jgi:hypothetical protein
MKRVITLAALAAATAAAHADWAGASVDMTLKRHDMPDTPFVMQSAVAGPDATRILNFAGVDMFEVMVEGSRIQVTALGDPTVLNSAGAGTALHMIDIVAANPAEAIKSAKISLSEGIPPAGWDNASAFDWDANGVYIPLNSIGDLAYLQQGTTITVDLTFVPAPGAAGMLALAGLAATRRRR